MGTRLTVFNQKGGVGKTTTTLNLGAALARAGFPPVLVDLDAQAHLTSILSPISSSKESLFTLYSESKPLSGIARPVAFGGQLIPAHTELIKIDSMFGKGPDVLNRLKQSLDAGYEVSQPVVIDCSPMLGVLSLSAVFATERVLVPVSADYLAMKGAVALEKTLKALEHVLKQRVERRYVITRFDSRRRMAHDIAAQLGERYGAELCETRIAESVGIAESPAFGKDVFTHDPEGRGAQDYAQLLDELRSSGFWSV